MRHTVRKLNIDFGLTFYLVFKFAFFHAACKEPFSVSRGRYMCSKMGDICQVICCYR